MSIIGCYYLHQNGDLLYVSGADSVPDIRDSDFARGLWTFDPEDRAKAWSICVEALASGAKKERVLALAAKWGCDDDDASHYAKSLNADVFMDGNQWCATGPGFRNLQEDRAGFGNTPLEAFANLCQALGYKPSKMWGHTFKSLLERADHNNSQFGVGA